jgi:hypothetical protein
MREGRGEVTACVLTPVGAGLARVLSLVSKGYWYLSDIFPLSTSSPNAPEPNPSRVASTPWTIQYGRGRTATNRFIDPESRRRGLGRGRYEGYSLRIFFFFFFFEPIYIPEYKPETKPGRS